MSSRTRHRLGLKKMRRAANASHGVERDALLAEVALVDAQSRSVNAERTSARSARGPFARMGEHAANSARATLAAVTERVARVLGLNVNPASATSPAPAAAATPSAVADDADVSTRIRELLTVDRARLKADVRTRANYRDTLARNMATLEHLISAVAAADPTGKVFEQLDDQDPTVRRKAAATIAPLLRAAEAGSVATSAKAPTRSAPTPPRVATPAPTPAPKGESIVGKLSGVAKTAAAMREQAGLEPLAQHRAAVIAGEREQKKRQ